MLEAVKDGSLRDVVSCTTLRDSGQDVHSVRVVRELIRRDVLVLSMGRGNGAMQVAGLCSLETKRFAGPRLKGLYEKLGVPRLTAQRFYYKLIRSLRRQRTLVEWGLTEHRYLHPYE